VTLYHFTCTHAERKIGRAGGVLRPFPHALTPVPLIWMTDLAEPDVDRLGLTSYLITCDRTEVRYRIPHPDRVVPWIEWADERGVDAAARFALELDHDPLTWFVSERPQRTRR